MSRRWSLALAVLVLPTAALAQELESESSASSYSCPWVDPLRSVTEAFDARNAALAAGDLDLAMCAYAEDAKVILPGTILIGRAQIKAALASFGSMFGGAQPQITSSTATHSALLITYTITGPQVSIPDGSDTFVAALGRIRIQTVHATLAFTQALAP